MDLLDFQNSSLAVTQTTVWFCSVLKYNFLSAGSDYINNYLNLMRVSVLGMKIPTHCMKYV